MRLSGLEPLNAGGDRLFHGAYSTGLQQNADRGGISLQNQLAVPFLLNGRGTSQKLQHRQCQFTLAQVGSERFPGYTFATGEIDTVIIDLVGGTEMTAKIFQCCDMIGTGIIQPRSEFGRDGKQSRRL